MTKFKVTLTHIEVIEVAAANSNQAIIKAYELAESKEIFWDNVNCEEVEDEEVEDEKDDKEDDV